MESETREQKRERLFLLYQTLHVSAEEDLLSVVESAERAAAEEARASERERCNGILKEQQSALDLTRDEYWALQAALEAIRAAPPSPEPERSEPETRPYYAGIIDVAGLERRAEALEREVQSAYAADHALERRVAVLEIKVRDIANDLPRPQ